MASPVHPPEWSDEVAEELAKMHHSVAGSDLRPEVAQKILQEMWHHRTGCAHPNYPTEKLREVAAKLNHMFLKDHERLLTMYRSRSFRFLTNWPFWEYVCRAFEFCARWLCWEYTISTDILKHSLYDLSPPDEDTVRMWVPCVGTVDAGRVLALVFNFGGGRGKGRAQMQLVALRALVEGNSIMFVMVLIFVILTVLMPAAVVLWILAMAFTFKFHKLAAAFQGSCQLLHRHCFAIVVFLLLPLVVAGLRVRYYSEDLRKHLKRTYTLYLTVLAARLAPLFAVYTSIANLVQVVAGPFGCQSDELMVEIAWSVAKGGLHLLVLVFVSPFMSNLAQVMKCRVPFLEAAMHRKLCDHTLLAEPAQ
ncbi:unnamed protein product [Symbiodinium sp. CCMP2592]|nr:unnamed protein product [Symbiodinium sp. CCMP2592]